MIKRVETASGRVLLIRVDADSYMGIGHIMRCLALAQGWQNAGGRAVFLSKLPEALADQLAANGIKLIPAIAHDSDTADLEQTLSVAQSLRRGRLKNILVALDGYHFTTTYQQALHQSGLHTLVLDDFTHLSAYYATWLLNQNLWADTANYTGLINTNCRILAGLNFTLLRREVITAANRKYPSRQGGSQFRVLVTMGGGADPTDVIGLVVEAIAAVRLQKEQNLVCTVVVGPFYSRQQTLEARFAATNLAGEILTNIADIPNSITSSDLAITAGGSTCWELAYLGIPMLILALNDNQVYTGRSVAVTNAAIDLGQFRDTLATRTELAGRITAKLVQLLPNVTARAAMAVAGQQLIDGHGTDRVLAALLEIDKL